MRKVPTGEHSFKWVKEPPDHVRDFWFKIEPGIFVAFLLACVFGGAYLMYYLFDGPTITLTKNDWHCTREHTMTIPITQMAGNSPIITFMPITSCVVYHRNGF